MLSANLISQCVDGVRVYAVIRFVCEYRVKRHARVSCQTVVTNSNGTQNVSAEYLKTMVYDKFDEAWYSFTSLLQISAVLRLCPKEARAKTDGEIVTGHKIVQASLLNSVQDADDAF